MIDEMRREYENCPTCHNERHITRNGRVVRCNCVNKAHFITYFEQAHGNEEYIDMTLCDPLKELLSGRNKTAALTCMNGNKRVKYIHTALYIGARSLLTCKIVSDQEIASSIFNPEEDFFEPQWSPTWDKYTKPGFLILKLCTIKNTRHLSAHIMHSIIYPREDRKKFTLIVLPSLNCIQNMYSDEEMHEFIYTLLKNKNAYLIDSSGAKLDE